MDQAAIQQLIDDAVAAQQLQHQAAMDAANIANAAALATAIATLPPPAAAAAGAAGAAGAFALTPGLANPGQPWDYTANEGLKIFNSASAKLQKEEYDGGVVQLKQLLKHLEARANTYGWDDLLFTISNQAATPSDKNLLTQYGVLSLDNVRAHATAYIGQHNRAAQAAVQLRDSLMATLSPKIMTQMVTKERGYLINGVKDGTCMLMVLMTLIFVETRATVSVIHAKLRGLINLLKVHKSDITAFNLEVSDSITALSVLEETCPDLLLSLFNAYETASDKDFRDHIRQQKSNWLMNEIAVLTVVELMTQAEGRYKVAVETGTWAKPLKHDADVIALAAAINAKQEEAAKKPTGGATASTNTRTRNNGGDWAWKMIAPTGNQSKEKTYKNKVYVACPFHKGTQWVLKSGHEGGCRNDPDFVPGVAEMMKKSEAKTAEDKKPVAKKTMQFAHALMMAMEAEENGELDGEAEG
jgi:hypothetical protein